MNRARWNPQYYQHVLATDPIGYWMQDEKQGAVSYDMVTARSNAARNGAYTGVTLGQPGIGDGRTAPFFDGANDFNNIFSASLQAAFNGSEGTVMAWARVFNVGVWADGNTHEIISFFADAQNYIRLAKIDPNTLWCRCRTGGTSKTISFNTTTTDWFALSVTYSLSAGITGEMKLFFNGIQMSITQDGLAAWNPPINLVRCYIGSEASIPAPSLVWHGYIAHVAVWDRPLTPAQIAVLYEEAFA